MTLAEVAECTCDLRDRTWNPFTEQCGTCGGFNPAHIRKQRAAAQLALWDLVIADMKKRDASGEKTYGVRLRAHNGRDALQDAYEEALDLAVYLKQALIERGAK